MLLTFQNERRQPTEEMDIDVPPGMTAGLFKERWLKAAGTDQARTLSSYLVEGKEPGGSWFPLPDPLAFADSGLKSGGFIRIKAIYSTAELPEGAEGSLPLFQNRSALF